VSQLRELLPSVFNTLSMQLMVPLPKTPSGWPLRFLFLCFWLHCLLLSVSYRASFASQLAKPAPRIALDTVDKLANAKQLTLLTYEFFAKYQVNFSSNFNFCNSALKTACYSHKTRLDQPKLNFIHLTVEAKAGKLFLYGLH